MPITGLVLTLDAHGERAGAARDRTLATLRAFAALQLGELVAGRVPAVLEADDYAAHDARLDELRGVPGVAWVDVVFHDFSDLRDFERPPRERRAGLDTDDGGSHGAA